MAQRVSFIKAGIDLFSQLGEDFTEVTQADCLYLHDMAVSSDARGQGVAQQLLAAAEQQARQCSLSALTLVAVQNSASYWQQRGFHPVTALTSQAIQNLASYTGQQAQYLAKTW
ncbi:GNAT family N-acetyltransferase [Pseudomonas aeruginosa]|uniref:GNAT family N-acetyltransferase n=1 Tax=Pseudomonas aeruginosa TaxID=287 RepID=UPI00349FF61E